MENIGDPRIIASAGAIMVVVQAIKPIEQIPSKFYPLISLTLGVVLGVIQGMTLIEGVMIGASASGVYAGVKKSLE